MQFKPRQSRAIALLTGGVLAATTLFHPAPAQADKAKTYKYGAIGLGVLGAYMLAKGKTVPGAAAVAGGAYAYKKSREAEKENRNNDWRYNDNRYDSRYNDGRYGYDSNYRREDRNERREENREERREQRRANRQAQRDNRATNYDLSPYLR